MPAVGESVPPPPSSRRHTRHHRSHSASEPASNVSEEVRRQAQTLVNGLSEDEIVSLLPKLHEEVRATSCLLQSGLASFPEHEQIHIDQAAGLAALATAYITRTQCIIDGLQAKLRLRQADIDTQLDALGETAMASLRESKESVENALRESKESVENAMQHILLWRDLAKRRVADLERDKEVLLADKEVLLADKKVLLAVKEVLLADKEVLLADKKVLLADKEALIVQVDGLKKDLKVAKDEAEYWKLTAKEQAEQYEQKVDGLKKDLKVAKDEAEYWKLTAKEQAEQYEQKISVIRGNVRKAKDQRTIVEQKRLNVEQLEAAARAARESAKKAEKDTGKMLSDIEESMEDEDPGQTH